MKFSVFQLSRVGGREKNEDRMGYCFTREASMFMLADGMGGHPEGETAAQIALQTMSARFQRDAKPRLPEVAPFLSSAVKAAHQQIVRHASARAMLDTPRTTLVVALIQGGNLYWVHCGDSRLYIVRDGQLVSRTRDHSYLEAQGRAGMPLKGINRNVLFTCLGSAVRPVFDISGPLLLKQGDKMLLCSDGLWGCVEDKRIVAALSAQPVAKVVPELVDEALKNGGSHADNVTALAIEWEGTSQRIGNDSSGFTQTETMSVEGFASTIQADEIDPVTDNLDESAIDRSIEEINEAIQRSVARRR
ncbi:PP2C family protein-serine/threonine phosphatase [Ottowia thiooxydans]|uniref:PP2C family protein-serine/threonine phosphatase n=1 Tax=Ottowia thiooxydans TaxID=219182 RepID=UPI000490F304|nr:PP2C family serine/threonine-protein phosphatase [Ottowia thiooxydans]